MQERSLTRTRDFVAHGQCLEPPLKPWLSCISNDLQNHLNSIMLNCQGDELKSNVVQQVVHFCSRTQNAKCVFQTVVSANYDCCLSLQLRGQQIKADGQSVHVRVEEGFFFFLSNHKVEKTTQLMQL